MCEQRAFCSMGLVVIVEGMITSSDGVYVKNHYFDNVYDFDSDSDYDYDLSSSPSP